MRRLVLGWVMLGFLAACEREPACESCPDVGGEWTMTVDSFVVPPDQTCVWSEQPHEVPLLIEQPTPGGPEIAFVYVAHRLSGTISAKNVFTVQEQSQELRDSIIYDRTDVLSGPFNADANAFDGNLNVTLNERGSANVCTASATVRGVKR